MGGKLSGTLVSKCCDQHCEVKLATSGIPQGNESRANTLLTVLLCYWFDLRIKCNFKFVNNTQKTGPYIRGCLHTAFQVPLKKYWINVIGLENSFVQNNLLDVVNSSLNMSHSCALVAKNTLILGCIRRLGARRQRKKLFSPIQC